MTRDNNCFLTDDTFAVNDNAASDDDDDDDGPLNHSTQHNELKHEKKPNFKCVFGWMHDYLKG